MNERIKSMNEIIDEWRITEQTELEVCVKEFFEKYLNRTEESDGGKMFNPITISCCRVMMTQPLNELLEKMRVLSGAKSCDIEL
jgi:3'-phosphoadenosine 5'-phosphosulfate sulfotransferase (PAPS reductase)/FAD synthetase